MKLYRYEKTGPFANDVPLWRSEREYVLNASQPRQPHVSLVLTVPETETQSFASQRRFLRRPSLQMSDIHFAASPLKRFHLLAFHCHSCSEWQIRKLIGKKVS